MPIVDNGNQWLKGMEIESHGLYLGCWRERYRGGGHATVGCLTVAFFLMGMCQDDGRLARA